MKRTLLTLAVTSLLATTALADPIHVAAKVGDLAGVQAELDKGVDVNVKDRFGFTPLREAAWYGHKEIAELLLDKGTDVNAKGGPVGRTPLHEAALRGHKEIAELLIANGADVNAKDNYGATPLDWAIDDEIADLIRNHGGKTGEEWTALIDAAADGNIEVVKQLLAAGANVNAKNKWGGTPLHWAARGGHKEIVELLIAKGVNVNAKDDEGETPLDQAGTSWPEISDLLRKHGGKTGEELALMPRLVQHGRFAFSFVAMEGKVYEIQDSFDLLNWEVIKTYNGTGASVRFDEERDHDPLQIFYRVKLVE